MAINHDTGRIPGAEELANRLAIFDVLAQHSRGVDRADAEILKSCYWPDADVNYGGFVGNAHEFCDGLPTGIKGFKLTQHSVSNISIDFRGDDALVESYVTAYHFMMGGSETEMTYIGRYLDKMQRRNSNWKINHRTICMDWNQNVPTTAQWDGDLFGNIKVRGTHETDDPLYGFLKG